MTRQITKIKLTLVAAAALACLVMVGVRVAAVGDDFSFVLQPPAAPPNPPGRFSPSNAQTEDGELIPADQFFPAARCANCHQDTHEAWSESLHRNAAREPFYRESADILLRTRGPEPTAHCESCHSPVALFAGTLTKNNPRQTAPFTHLDDEGVTCSVCHSITEARLDGTGSYTIRRPALLAREDGTPVYGNITDEQILADVLGHKRAVMRPLLKQPEFCATCHKSDIPPSLNNYKHLRGFNAYDEWQQSGRSAEAVAPYYRSEHQVTCNACHMPEIESANDLAAKEGMIKSHRWLGANTAAPLFYGQKKQVELTEEFLQNNVISADIFALKREASGVATTELGTRAPNKIALQPGEEVTVEVVVANRKAAHSFPPELRDVYEPWVEFEAIDGDGVTFYHSGFIKADGTLDESAHVYRAIILDERGRPITRHQVWLARIKAYDNALPAGRSDVVRFRFRLPLNAKRNSLARITLRARVNYRRFIEDFSDYVLGRQNATQLQAPVVRMTATEVLISDPRTAFIRAKAPGSLITPPTPAQQARRWNDYGIGLMEQAQYGAAADAFKRASLLDPKDPDPLVSAAVAEMRTERFGPGREQLLKAAVLLDAALKLNPRLARARFYRALVLRGQREMVEAARELALIAKEYPRDREVQRQLGQTLYALGRVAEARVAFEAVAAIDPTDAGAYQFLAPIFASENRQAEAARARALYLLWRDDPLADFIAARFFAANPQWADERILSHTHGADPPLRPSLTGSLAAPEK